MRTISFVLLVYLLAVEGCIDPYQVTPKVTQDSTLVVEGFLSTGSGPYKISLSRTRVLYSDLVNAPPVTGATVQVLSGAGEKVYLIEKTAGNYETPPTFKANVDEEYQLQIFLSDGLHYSSAWEKAPPVTKMTGLDIHYQPKYFYAGNTKNTIDGLNISVVLEDNPTTQNFGVVEVETVYKVQTSPANGACCSICWIDETMPAFSVVSDALYNGKNERVELPYFKLTSKYLLDKIRFTVRQKSLSKDAYRFFSIFHKTQNSQGALFNSLPSPLPGNISNTKKPNEQVIGFFYVTEEDSLSTFLSPESLPISNNYYFNYQLDCRTLPNSTTQQPSFW